MANKEVQNNDESLAINNVMDVEEASVLWEMSPSRIKVLCVNGTIQARKLGRYWVLEKNQPNPRRFAQYTKRKADDE